MKTALVQLPIDKIDPPTSNPRFSPVDLGDLVDSIREIGIIEPLVVVAAGVGSDRVRLVAGLRRFTSAKVAGLATVPCIVHAALDARQELAISLVENLHRKDMSPVESGEAFHKLMQTGMSQVQVGKMVGVSDFTVSTCIAIARKLCPDARDACHEGTINKTQAFDLTRFGAKDQMRVLTSILNRKETQAIYQATSETRKRHGTGASEAETYLRSAITALKGMDKPLAIELAEKALELMRKTDRHLQAVV